MERLAALPFSKSVEIAYKSIRVRFFRSLVTTASLVLAVAFLCYVQVVSDIATSLLQSGDPAALRALARAGYDINGVSSIGESAQQQWLVVLSLLVCVVGIINAQLMAVTERFREIGTMKCLGALDRVIMLLFLLEAGMQGFAGSLIGVLVGGLAGVASSAISLGTIVFTGLPPAALALTGFQSVLIGCLLSLVGVLYPAIAAARMEPVEAMRVEQ
ncbi:MAG TPA: FtsX-like permease family protein [Desulfobulbus sp.]|nr:FtsX-like permease family protein [Desulfobulbus sp.]